MAIANIYKVHTVEPTTGNYISNLTSFSLQPQVNVVKDVNAGQIFASSGRLEFETFDLQCTTTMAKEALDQIPTATSYGSCFGGALEVYVAAYDCSGPLSGANHLKYTLTGGIIFLNSLSCDHKGDLEVSFTVRATSSPAITTGATLPTVPGLGDRWTLNDGDDTLNNVSLVRKTSVNVDFGVDVQSLGADSEEVNSFIGINSIQPVTTIEGLDPTWFDTLGLSATGTVVDNTQSKIYFRKRDGAGSYVSDITAEHISLELYGPAHFSSFLSGSGTDAASCSVQIDGTSGGSESTPVHITVDTAIT